MGDCGPSPPWPVAEVYGGRELRQVPRPHPGFVSGVVHYCKLSPGIPRPRCLANHRSHGGLAIEGTRTYADGKMLREPPAAFPELVTRAVIGISLPVAARGCVRALVPGTIGPRQQGNSAAVRSDNLQYQSNQMQTVIYTTLQHSNSQIRSTSLPV